MIFTFQSEGLQTYVFEDRSTDLPEKERTEISTTQDEQCKDIQPRRHNVPVL
jgi:hypothetical protein